MRILVARRPRVELATAALGLAVVALYAPVLHALVAVWAGIPYYSYGFLVPIFSVYLAWDARRQLASRPSAPSRLGLGILAAGFGVLVVGGAVAVALVANWLRVAGTGMMAELYGREAAEGLTHVVWGKIVYGAMLVPFALLVLALRRRP